MSVLFVAAVVTQYRLILPITITAGCLLALALHTRSGFEIGWRVLGWRAAPVALGLAALAGLTFLKEPWIAVVDVLFALLTAACVIREDHLLAPFLRLRAIAYIGTISYGIYLLHPLVYGALQLPLFGAIAFTVPGFFVSTALTLIAATLSFRYFEGPFLRWKHRFDVRR
jgi:peptidoglycan/LPS O-acetylase OafA/YrhL